MSDIKKCVIRCDPPTDVMFAVCVLHDDGTADEVARFFKREDAEEYIKLKGWKDNEIEYK